MKIEDVLIPKNIGKKFKFNLNGQEVITEVKGYYTCGYQKIVLDFIDEINFKEVEREIDWSKIPKWTKVLVKNEPESEYQNAYFMGVNNEEGEILFAVTFYDMFIFEDRCGEGEFEYFDCCKLHPTVEISEEWYKDYIEEDCLKQLY